MSEYGKQMFGVHDMCASVGITGSIEFVELDGPEVLLSLAGQFWHRRETVLGKAAIYLNARIPEITSVRVSDPADLEDFEDIVDDLTGEILYTEDKRSEDFNGDRGTMEYQGGGVSAAIAAACTCNSLAEKFPSLLLERNLTVSTVSGGSMSATLEEIMLGGILGGRTKEPSRAFDDAPNTECRLPVGKFVGELRQSMLRLAFNRKSFGNETGTHWWQSIVEQIFHTACIENITVGDLAWKTSYALLGGDASPTRGDNGALTADSANNLDHVVVEISDEKILVEQALAHSTSFWAASILTLNPVVRRLFGNLVHIDQNNSKVLDGGVVDTTGVVTLLGQQSSTILAFYNNNAPLSKLGAPIAYLFGVDAPTDSMNSLLGPKFIASLSLESLWRFHLQPF
ncbi:hypothetical protein THAOC_27753 [Thalassiosira oceanica]|uniref:Uncharacterized protein n=1 Tax=Thalassiosira oceanica TaxID=159749 RepID=K0RGP7_THAOC|nr:hypothetical protein THAOC_27753 [Thalassiosira oceanica]|eukprot:EJK52918.1 hypothetical protein THAOC_27753 [Thalassiosira oceanica]